MIKKYDIVATVGTYKDRQTGHEKKRYQTCGAVFADDDGRLSIKMEALPLSKDWSGWFACYEPKQDSSRPPVAPPARSEESDYPY